MTLIELVNKLGLDPKVYTALSQALAFNMSGLMLSAKKDEDRIRMFILAVAKRETEFATQIALTAIGDPVTAQVIAADAKAFTLAAADLVTGWATKTRRLSFADLFRDPYKDLRQQTRVLAARWQLDDSFRQAMG